MAIRAWFITGTSQGIGRSLALELIRRGEKVAATARTPESLRDLVEMAPERVWVSRLDVTNSDQREAAVRGAIPNDPIAPGHVLFWGHLRDRRPALVGDAP
jgi:NAD(P)-dependent dehydrogenase (short-subunit alcohol dehydrogenase family)